jgi:hypothetical protein
MSKDSLMNIWERVRNEIRRLRGINRFRGTETHLLPKRQVRLPAEFRGDRGSRGEYVIHLSDAESEVWLEEWPGNRRWNMEDFDMDLEALVRHAVDLCRGEDYLHTNSKEALYRKPKNTEESNA